MKILIGDDHELILQGIIASFQSEGRSDELKVAKNKEELLSKLEREDFEVLILDVQFGKDDARKIIQTVSSLYPNIKKIALSSFEDEFTVKSVLAAGFQAYVSKQAPLTELIEAVDSVIEDQNYISKALKERLFSVLFSKDAFAEQIVLTRREKEVLAQIQAGLSTKEMAEKLSISEKTIETYRSNLMLKFQVKNVASLVRVSLLKGFVFE